MLLRESREDIELVLRMLDGRHVFYAEKHSAHNRQQFNKQEKKYVENDTVLQSFHNLVQSDIVCSYYFSRMSRIVCKSSCVIA